MQASSSTFNVHDAEIMKSSLDTPIIQELLPSLSVPAQIPEVNASEETFCEIPADRVSAVVSSMPAHPLNVMGRDELQDVEMFEDVENIVLRQACPSVNYQPEITIGTQSEPSSQRLSQLSSTSKRSGQGKDVNVLMTVLRSKYPHPILNRF